MHSVGLSRVRSGHRRCRLIWVTVIVAVLAAPATAAVASPPAVDQYTQHLPEAGGGSGPASGDTPIARPELLPRKTVADLSGHDGQLLAQIATARDLGAPAHIRSTRPGAGTGTSVGDHGFATVVADTGVSAPGLVLIGVLGGIALAGGWTRFSRRRSSADLG
jgi:hypothetical protein